MPHDLAAERQIADVVLADLQRELVGRVTSSWTSRLPGSRSPMDCRALRQSRRSDSDVGYGSGAACRQYRRRPTARSAVVPGRGQNRDTMTSATASPHLPAAAAPRFRHRITVAPPAPKARARPSITPTLLRRPLPQRQTRYRDRRSAADHASQRIPYPSRRRVKSP